MSALTPAVSTAWLTTAQEGGLSGAQVANPIYPGAVTTDHAGGSETVPGRDPVGGQDASQLPPDTGSSDVSGGGGQFPEYDYTGHSAPMADFDAQPLPFAPPGPIADTHSEDTGGYNRRTYVAPPTAKGWMRRTLTGQTMDSQSYSYTPEGFRINVPAGRTDYDQYQGQDADAYDPFIIGYSERPIYANLAYESQAMTNAQNAYTPSGQLPDFTPTGGQGDALYVTPDDPPVNSQATAAEPASGDVGWF